MAGSAGLIMSRLGEWAEQPVGSQTDEKQKWATAGCGVLLHLVSTLHSEQSLSLCVCVGDAERTAAAPPPTTSKNETWDF